MQKNLLISTLVSLFYWLLESKTIIHMLISFESLCILEGILYSKGLSKQEFNNLAKTFLRI